MGGWGVEEYYITWNDYHRVEMAIMNQTINVTDSYAHMRTHIHGRNEKKSQQAIGTVMS